MPIIRYSTRDIFNQKDASIIAHGVNCQGIMGAGFAKEIRTRFPDVYDEYKSVCDSGQNALLGSLLYVKTMYSDNVIGIINMFTQLNYGRNKKRYISYDAIVDCFEEMNKRSLYASNALVRMPKIGAGLGGGNWNIIEAIINEMTPNVKIIVHEKK